jgi:hypothetical protein
MPEPTVNPYAPPGAPPPAVAIAGPRGRSRSNYNDERRNVAILAILCVVTLGIYPSVWYVRRTSFLNSLGAHKSVGLLPWVSVTLVAAAAALSFTGVSEGAKVVQAASGLVSLVLAFRVAAILRSDFARSGRYIDVATLGVFFLGCLYLQHVMNEAAGVPAREGPSERTRDPDSLRL